MDDQERARIRGYLRAQAAKLTPAEVIDKVLTAMADLRRAAAFVPKDRFEERPAPGEWSGNEVMAHVVDVGRHFGDQVVDILDGRPRATVTREPSTTDRRPADEWSAILERDRAALFDRVRRADPTQALTETIEHQMFGPLDWREVLLFTRLHDLDHVGQLQQIAAALAARPA